MAKTTYTNSKTLTLTKEADKKHSIVFKGDDHSLYFRRDLFNGLIPDKVTVTINW